MTERKKVVFEDAGENRVARGYVEEMNDGFLKIIDNDKTTLINKKYIVFIRDDE